MNWYYKNVLIVTDNLIQSTQLYKLIKDHAFDKEINFNWACSTISDTELFNKQTGGGFRHVDFKKPEEVENVIKKYSLVISMHCKQLFPAELINKIKCINVHPGYNPVNRGWYPQVFSIINNTIIGATIHEIDEQLDHGNIIDRMEVPKYAWDTSLEIYNRVLEAEMLLLNKNLKNILCNTYETLKPENEGKLYLKKDFQQLCKLDLNDTGTFEAFINKLRALSHGPYKNAYFVDKASGKKVFVNIQLEV